MPPLGALNRVLAVGGVFPTLLGLAAVLLLAAPAHAQFDDAPVARLVVRSGQAVPGGKLLMQVELTWDGRPEEHVPGSPAIQLSRGATVRLGRTGSRFDGEQTRWWTDVLVDLPERGSQWEIGPARVDLVGGVLAGGQVVAPALKVGGKSRARQLLGQGIGSTLVVFAALLYVGLRWRSLSEDNAVPSKET